MVKNSRTHKSAPGKKVCLRPLLTNVLGSTVQATSILIRVRSAGLPRQQLSLLISHKICRSFWPFFPRVWHQGPNGPGPPGPGLTPAKFQALQYQNAAWSNSTCFFHPRHGGAWSVAIMSMVPSANPSIMAGPVLVTAQGRIHLKNWCHRQGCPHPWGWNNGERFSQVTRTPFALGRPDGPQWTGPCSCGRNAPWHPLIRPEQYHAWPWRIPQRWGIPFIPITVAGSPFVSWIRHRQGRLSSAWNKHRDV